MNENIRKSKLSEKLDTNIDIKYEENNNKKIHIGNRVFFWRGKFCYHKKPIGLSLTILLFTYFLIHNLYIFCNYYEKSKKKTFVIIICIINYIVQLFQIIFTSLSNPGVLRPLMSNIDTNNVLSSNLPSIASIFSQEFILKTCSKCGILIEPRIYHCRTCGICVLRHDHHCPFISTCVGIGNRRSFFILLLICVENLIYYIWMIYNNLWTNFSSFSLVDSIFAIILLGLIAISLIFIIILIFYQVYQMLTNQTTRERIKRKNNVPNPFTLGSYYQNFKEFWLQPLQYINRIAYNANAKKLIKYNVLLTDSFLSPLFPEPLIERLSSASTSRSSSDSSLDKEDYDSNKSNNNINVNNKSNKNEKCNDNNNKENNLGKVLDLDENDKGKEKLNEKNDYDIEKISNKNNHDSNYKNQEKEGDPNSKILDDNNYTEKLLDQ